MAKLDHIVFGCLELEPAAEALANVFGAAPAGRGRHEAMSTHNALWNMGDAYVELVAIDPGAPDPGRPRWFGLDEPATQARLVAGPRLLTWVAIADDPAAVAAKAPEPFGAPEDFARDDLRWRMAVPERGAPALDGVFPGPIEWLAGVHPAKRLGDQGLRLTALTVSHPDADAVAAAYGAVPAPAAARKGPPQIEVEMTSPKGALSFRAFG